MASFDRIAEEVRENGMRERGSDSQQRDPSRKANPGPLQEASVHGTPALPTDLNSAPISPLLIKNTSDKKAKNKVETALSG